MFKFFDDRGRLFGKISIVDIIAIAVIALLTTVLVMRNINNINPASSVNTIPVSYTIVIYGIRDSSANIIHVGDDLYTDSDIYIGTIANVSIADAKMTSLMLDGTYQSVAVEERFDVTLTVETFCSVADGRYYADRTYELCANTDQRIMTKYVDTSGTIMSINVR